MSCVLSCWESECMHLSGTNSPAWTPPSQISPLGSSTDTKIGRRKKEWHELNRQTCVWLDVSSDASFSHLFEVRTSSSWTEQLGETDRLTAAFEKNKRQAATCDFAHHPLILPPSLLPCHAASVFLTILFCLVLFFHPDALLSLLHLQMPLDCLPSILFFCPSGQNFATQTPALGDAQALTTLQPAPLWLTGN